MSRLCTNSHDNSRWRADSGEGWPFRDDNGAGILADFGIARILETSAHLTRTGSILGTPE